MFLLQPMEKKNCYQLHHIDTNCSNNRSKRRKGYYSVTAVNMTWLKEISSPSQSHQQKNGISTSNYTNPAQKQLKKV